MINRNIFIHINLYAALLFVIFFALRLGVSFKTGLEPTAFAIFKIAIMASCAITIFSLNIKAFQKNKRWLQYMQFPLLIPMFMPSSCVIKLGSAGNPVFIIAMFLILLSSVILISNLMLILKMDR